MELPFLVRLCMDHLIEGFIHEGRDEPRLNTQVVTRTIMQFSGNVCHFPEAEEAKIKQLSEQNEELQRKVERAKYVADHLMSEVATMGSNGNNKQLEEDYLEVEAELDEVTAINEKMKAKLVVLARERDEYKTKYEDLQRQLKQQQDAKVEDKQTAKEQIQ